MSSPVCERQLDDVNVGLRGPSIALVAFSSLGDGLIYLMMAENLRINGFRVTYFGDIGYQFREWIPQFEIRKYPLIEEFEEQLSEFDLAIVSPPQKLRDCMDEVTTDRLRRKFVLICQDTPDSWRYDLTETLRSTRTNEVYSALQGLLDSGGSIRHRRFADESVVDITLDYLRSRMHLSRLTRFVPLTPPSGLVKRRSPRRIIVSPDSAWPKKKDWSPRSFLTLCGLLRKHGYDPKIIVAPANHERWRTMQGNDFDTPVFHDVAELAAYIYESGAIIANDSGNGHLASFLGIPSVTIYRKRNPRFHWRPDWAPSAVVCPRVVLPGLSGPIWRPFVMKSDVISALKGLL